MRPLGKKVKMESRHEMINLSLEKGQLLHVIRGKAERIGYKQQ